MAAGKLTVRQKMINMMYLVLTALLALNVSAEILRAFHLVEVSMDRAGVNIESKNEITLASIEKYNKDFPTDSVGQFVYDAAIVAKKTADEGVKYVEELKVALITAVGGREEGKVDEQVAQPGNIEMHANYLIVRDNGAKGKELRLKIDEVKEKLINLVPAEKRSQIKSDLSTATSKNSVQTWESEMFEHTPLAAVIALLSKTQNDMKNTEAQVLDELNKMIKEDVLIIDKLEPKVIPNNGTYITLGSEYSADIFLAASSSRQEADITVNGNKIPIESGVGKYKLTANREGDNKYKAVITTTKSNGKKEVYESEASFFVLKPLAVISATKMNVVYIGLDNPFSVSVPGYSSKEINVSVTSGGVLVPDKQAGTYLLRVDGKSREVTISASVTKNNKTTTMGSAVYRVRQIPKPTPMLGGIESSGEVSSGQLKAAAFVFTALKDFAFEGIKFTPTSYKIVYQPKRGDAQLYQGSGQVITPQIKAAFNNARPGDRVILLDIKAQGPAGIVPIPTSLAIEVRQ